MRSEQVKIVNKLGLHARSASKLVNTAKHFPCQVKIGLDDNNLQNGKSIMGVLTLAAEKGATVIVQTDGPKEEQAMAAIKALFADRFGEPE